MGSFPLIPSGFSPEFFSIIIKKKKNLPTYIDFHKSLYWWLLYSHDTIKLIRENNFVKNIE